MREGHEYIHEFKERLSIEILWLQRKHHEIIDSKEPTTVKQSSLAELHRINITLANYFDIAPYITITHQDNDNSLSKTSTGIKEITHEQQPAQSSDSISQLLGKPFWIWDKEEHLRLAEETNEHCCFNHIVGLPVKDKIEHPIYDYEKILYDSLLTITINHPNNFKDKHLWVKKATGLGVTEFMLRLMAGCAQKTIPAAGGQSDVHNNRP